MKYWVKKAKAQGTLRITENIECPYHNPMHLPNVPTKLNACEEHSWVSRKWFDGRFGK